jgi:hypothetical protein
MRGIEPLAQSIYQHGVMSDVEINQVMAANSNNIERALLMSELIHKHVGVGGDDEECG